MASAFISHSSLDDRYVTELEQLVRSLGYMNVFNDGHTIEPDAKFWQSIEDGIRTCDAFIVVLSHTAVQSTWVTREVEFARQLAKKVIPVRIDDSALPATFADRDVIDLRQGRGDKVKIASSRILRHSPQRLFGRDDWLDALDAAWAALNRINVYALIAWGGAGKTSVVAHWVTERMVARQWPGVERYFDWSFYSQGARDQSHASADLFVARALEFFGDPNPQAGNPWDRGERLAALVRQHRTLLVLDGVEPLQYPPNSPQAGEFKDEALAALLQGLAMDNPGLCVVTSRETLTTLQSFQGDGGAVEEKHLDRLPKDAGVALLRHLEITGTDEELEAAWRDMGGHALTLQLLGRFLADAHGGDIRRRDEVDLEEADRETTGTAMKVLLAYEKWLESGGADRLRDLAVLRLTGLFDRPASAACLTALRKPPAIVGLTEEIVALKDTAWEKAIKDLERLELVTVERTATVPPSTASVDTHPLVREYFARQLHDRQPEAFRAAHSRLFDHLCKSTEPRPDTLAGLQPLYQAVTHGCLAGRHQEACDQVYFERILRGDGRDGFYSTRKLGAIGADLGALAAFFDEPWSRLSPNLSAADQPWLLNLAALRLRALGRLSEAVEPMRSAVDIAIEAEDWRAAAIRGSNLTELEVTLGRLSQAVTDGGRDIAFAERSEDGFEKMSKRAIAADALHQAGQQQEAWALFAEAERLQAEIQPQFPLLYTVRGFRYADLILVPAERAVWRSVFDRDRSGADADTPQAPDEGSGSRLPDSEEAISACTEAERRAHEAQRASREAFSNQPSLLDLALDHLTLARVALYRALLQEDAPSPAARDAARVAVEVAVSKFRQAARLDYLPKALLTAALHAEALAGQTDEARRFLDEAQLIAERGPMPLFLADVHLHRARLFRDRAELDQAGALIETHGYGRRREELADAVADAASHGWL